MHVKHGATRRNISTPKEVVLLRRSAVSPRHIAVFVKNPHSQCHILITGESLLATGEGQEARCCTIPVTETHPCT